MKKSIKFTPLISTFIALSGCSNAQATLNVSPDNYYEKLESIEQSFIDNDFDKMSSQLVALNSIKSTEVPNYEAFFFQAINDFENGKILEAKDKINMFEMMLLVDSGYVNCSDLSDVKELNIVHSKMCAEYLLSYYQNPTTASQNRILMYWYLVHLAKQRYIQF